MNKELPLVTIAIPTYNRADRYLRQALESARNQTYPNLDIIVADNCSVDGTEMLVGGISDPRIRYFKHQVNIGANNNHNFCLQQAKGVYFLLLCDDDLIDHDFIDACMKAANYDTNKGIIRTGIRLINANGQVLREIPNMVDGYSTGAFFTGWFSGNAPLYLCNTLFNTKKLKEIGGFRSRYNIYDDTMAMVRMAAIHGRIDVHEIKASPRLHASKLAFAEDIGEWCEESLTLLDLMCELASENSALIRQEGMRVLSQKNYARAMAVKSSLSRFVAYMIVFKKFHYKYLPPLYPRRLHLRRFAGIKVKMKRLLDGCRG